MKKKILFALGAGLVTAAAIAAMSRKNRDEESRKASLIAKVEKLKEKLELGADTVDALFQDGYIEDLDSVEAVEYNAALKEAVGFTEQILDPYLILGPKIIEEMSIIQLEACIDSIKSIIPHFNKIIDKLNDAQEKLFDIYDCEEE